MGHISVVHDDGQVWHGGPRSRWFLTVPGTDAAPQRQDSGLRQPPPASPVTTPSVDLAPPYLLRPEALPEPPTRRVQSLPHGRGPRIGSAVLRVDRCIHDIGLVRALARTTVVLHISDLHVRVLDASKGQVRGLIINPEIGYQRRATDWPERQETPRTEGAGRFPCLGRRHRARGGIRTRTPFRTVDFESTASAIPPPGPARSQPIPGHGRCRPGPARP